MCPACLTEIFGAVAGPAAGGAGALVLVWRRCKQAKPMAEPPTPTFQEWIAAMEASGTEHAVDGGLIAALSAPPQLAHRPPLTLSVPFTVANGLPHERNPHTGRLSLTEPS